MKIINTFKDKKITLLVVFLILFINITAYSQNTNDSGTTNTTSTTLVEKEQKRKVSSELSAEPTIRSQKETPTNEQEDEEDWVVENDGNWTWLWIISLIISFTLPALMCHLCVKKLDIEDKTVLKFPYIFLVMFTSFMIIALNNKIITKRKYISSIVVGKRIEKGRTGKIYEVRTDYKGVIFTHYFSKKNYDKINRKDTFCFEVRNGLWNTNISSKENARIKHHQEGSKIISKNKQYTNNKQLLIDDLNSQVSLAENSKGHIYIEFSLSSPLLSANDIKILSGNKKVKDEFIKFISNLNNCGKVSESGKYVLYCEFDKGIIVKADLTKIGLRDLKVRNIKSEIKLDIPHYKQYIYNQQLLLDDLNSQVTLTDNSKGHFYIEFSLSGPSMSANDIKVLSGNKKAKNEFIKFIKNLNNCGKIAKSGKYVLYCEFDKGKIHRADLTKTD